MSPKADRHKVPVILLYNVDPLWSSDEQAEVERLSVQLADAMASVGHPTTRLPVRGSDLPSLLRTFLPGEQIVFNWCDDLPDTPKSESLVPGILDSLGFAFTGADASALKLSWNKRTMKETLARCGIPTPAWRIYEEPCADGWAWYPAIVKAACEHCSEGLTRDSVVMTEAELEARIAHVMETYKQPALVEDFVDGREFHISLWGNGAIEMLPPAEMDFSAFGDIRDRLCTYDSKFVPGSAHYEGIHTVLPAALSKAETASLKRVCQAAYRAIGCRDYGRIDLRMRNNLFYVLDVNPNADISADASFACAAELAGYSYGETVSRIVRLAAARHARRKQEKGRR
jgi:D-alanine-D-alanine ligase